MSLREIQEEGRCREEGSHWLFFSEIPAELAEAQQICAACAVQAKCLQVALDEGIDWGVWGGVIFWDGEPFHRRRGRGRPPLAERGLPLQADRAQLREFVASA